MARRGTIFEKRVKLTGNIEGSKSQNTVMTVARQSTSNLIETKEKMSRVHM